MPALRCAAMPRSGHPCHIRTQPPPPHPSPLCAPQQRGVRQVVLLTGGVYLLSPLLHSLTRTISEDSIIAMTVGLLILHLYLHDYK